VEGGGPMAIGNQRPDFGMRRWRNHAMLETRVALRRALPLVALSAACGRIGYEVLDHSASASSNSAGAPSNRGMAGSQLVGAGGETIVGRGGQTTASGGSPSGASGGHAGGSTQDQGGTAGGGVLSGGWAGAGGNTIAGGAPVAGGRGAEGGALVATGGDSGGAGWSGRCGRVLRERRGGWVKWVRRGPCHRRIRARRHLFGWDGSQRRGCRRLEPRRLPDRCLWWQRVLVLCVRGRVVRSQG
jgi:hypothetical protein